MFARKTLATPSADTYTRVAFFVNSWGTQAALIRLRDASAVSIGNVYLSNIGHVGFHVDVAGSTNTQGSRPRPRPDRAGTRSSCTSPSTERPPPWRSGSTASRSRDSRPPWTSWHPAPSASSRSATAPPTATTSCTTTRPTGRVVSARSADSTAPSVPGWSRGHPGRVLRRAHLDRIDRRRRHRRLRRLPRRHARREPRQRHHLHRHVRAGVHCVQLHRARPGHLGQPVGAVRGAPRDHAGGGGAGLRRRLRVG